MSPALLLMLAACGGPTEPDGPRPAPTTPTVDTGITGTVSTTSPSTTPPSTEEPSYAELPQQCGEVDLVMQISSVGLDRAWAAAPTPDGGVVIAGEIYGSATFDEGGPNETTLSGGGAEGFVAKYQPDGGMDWVQHISGVSNVRVKHIDVADDGQIAITGTMSSEAFVEPHGPNTIALPYRGNGADSDVFVVVLDDHGQPVWGSSMGAAGLDLSAGVALDESGAVYLHGSNDNDGIEFGPVGSGIWLDNDDDEPNTFVARYEADGTVGWVRLIAGPDGDHAAALAQLPTGDVVAIGKFYTEITFAVGQPDAVTVMPEFAHAGAQLAYLAAFSPTGDLLWTRTPGSLDAGEFPEDAVSTPGGFMFTGFSGFPAVFGEGEPNAVTLPDGFTMYYASYRSDGTVAFVNDFQPSPSSNAVFGIAIAEGGVTATAGFVVKAYEWPPGLQGHVVSGDAGGAQDPFVATWDPDGSFRCAWVFENEQTGNPLPEGRAVAFDGEGGLWFAGNFNTSLRVAAGTPNETILSSKAGSNDMFIARIRHSVPARPALDPGFGPSGP